MTALAGTLILAGLGGLGYAVGMLHAVSIVKRSHLQAYQEGIEMGIAEGVRRALGSRD